MEAIVFLFTLFVRIYGFFRGKKFRHSQVYEDNVTYMGFDEILWYGYKYLVRQIEDAEPGKGIEGYFAAQDFRFDTDGFVESDSMLLSAGGDLLTTEKITPSNTAHIWDDVGDFFFDADIICANLETPLVPGRPRGYLGNIFKAANLNNSPEMFQRFSYNGKSINFLSTANNHSLDQGEDGLAATIDFLRSSGCGFAGTATSPEEQADIPVVVCNNIKIAFIAYTYALNGREPGEDKRYLANYIRLNKEGTDLSLIREHVKIARQKGADMVVACLHWGMEYESFPLQIGIDMGHRVLECGVDIILGNHPHTIQPAETYRFTDPFTGEEKLGFIAYALGDLMPCLSYDKNSILANLIKLKISKGTKDGRTQTRVTGLQMKPTYAWAQTQGKSVVNFQILDLVKLIDAIDSGECRFSLSKKEIKEIYRLGKLMHKVFPQLESVDAGRISEKVRG
ncbi:MAG: CapA family protein [Clostridia bacterium]|nr:CapA family protein [Clostridia bacterium]